MMDMKISWEDLRKLALTVPAWPVESDTIPVKEPPSKEPAE
jgi:hypothetical protein